MVHSDNTRSSSLEANVETARFFVDAFDELVRQVIVPDSHKAAQDLQMGPQDVRALIWLGRRERCLMTDLAKGVGVPLSTATHLANRLVEKKVMFRERSEQDRRVVFVGLSNLGKKLDLRFFQLRLGRSKTLLSKLNPVEQEQLVTLLRKALAEPLKQVPTREKERKK